MLPQPVEFSSGTSAFDYNVLLVYLTKMSVVGILFDTKLFLKHIQIWRELNTWGKDIKWGERMRKMWSKATWLFFFDVANISKPNFDLLI